jgi:hypothetical protein
MGLRDRLLHALSSAGFHAREWSCWARHRTSPSGETGSGRGSSWDEIAANEGRGSGLTGDCAETSPRSLAAGDPQYLRDSRDRYRSRSSRKRDCFPS